MIVEAVLAAGAVASISLIGALIFGGHKGLVGIERYVVPVAVGIFLSLVLFELIPETLAESPKWGGVAVAAGFIAFYILAQFLHRKYHSHDGDQDDCRRKSSATLLLIGDAFHNMADGIILGGAFLIDPTVGVATAIGLALHEVPQEIIEFGVFIRAGYSRVQAALRNLLSASSIILGTLLVLFISEQGGEWVWILTGVAAGALLFLSASDLLPRIHGNLEHYGSIWYATLAIMVGFLLMTITIEWTHSTFGHGHEHDTSGQEYHDEHDEHDEHDDDSEHHDDEEDHDEDESEHVD